MKTMIKKKKNKIRTKQNAGQEEKQTQTMKKSKTIGGEWMMVEVGDKGSKN